jgi:hypothetical protein
MAVVSAGFVGFQITWRADVFSGAPQSSSASAYGTLGINFRARKVVNDEEWQAALAELTCDRRPTSDGDVRANLLERKTLDALQSR